MFSSLKQGTRSCALLLVLVGAILAVMGVLLYTHGSEPIYRPENDIFFRVFDSSLQPNYNKLIKKIDSSDKVVLMGRQADGLYQFVKYYLRQKYPRFDVKWRDLTTGQFEYHTNRAVGLGYELIQEHILLKKHRPIKEEWHGDAICITGDRRYLWLLDNGNRSLLEIDYSKLNDLLEEYPDDKFLIVNGPSPQKVKITSINYWPRYGDSKTEAPREHPIQNLSLQNGVVGYSDGAYHWTEYDFIYAYSHLNRFLCKDTFELATSYPTDIYTAEPILPLSEDEEKPEIPKTKKQLQQKKEVKAQSDRKARDVKSQRKLQQSRNEKISLIEKDLKKPIPSSRKKSQRKNTEL